MKNIPTPIILAVSLAGVLGLTALFAQRFGNPRTQPESPVAAADISPSLSRPPVTAPANGKIEMRDVQIIDAAGFGQPLVSATTQMPVDWVAQGGVGWERSSDCVMNHLRFQWATGSPDGEQVFEAMPAYNWQVQGTEIQMNPCPVLSIRSTREFLQMVAQRYPNAQILEYRDRPDLLSQPPQPATPNTTVRQEAGQLVLGYHGNGREMRALLTTTLTFSELQGNVVVGSTVVYAQRAPKGRLDGRIGEHIMKSMKVDQRWMAVATQTMRAAIERVSQRQRDGIAAWHSARMADINARGAAARSAIRMQTNREVAQIYSNTWANGMATDEAIQRRTLEGIGGYNTYADPAGGGTVRESIEYDRVLRTESGNYISTDDPYLNPAGSEELQRIR